MTPGAPRSPSATTRLLLCAAALAGLGVTAYASALHAPFLLDDKMHIVREDSIKPPVSIPRVLRNDRPIVSLSLALNYAIGRLDVFGYHAVNLAAHILCAVLLFGWARHTLRLPALRGRYGAAADALAGVTAAVFLLHPLQTESVTYVVQRAEIFAALSLLGALWIAAVLAAPVNPGGRKFEIRNPKSETKEENSKHEIRNTASKSRGFRIFRPFWSFGFVSNFEFRISNFSHLGPLLGIALVAAFGSFSKESAVILPVLFALYDWCCIAAGQPRAMLRRWPIYAVMLLAAGTAAGLRWWQVWQQPAALGGVDLSGFQLTPSPAADPHAITPWRYLSWQCGVVLYYLRLVVVPDRLCFDCGYLVPWPVRASWLGERVWLPALILAAIAVAAWRVRRHYPLVTFCLLAGGVALAPTSSVLPLTDVYVEHRLYLPIAFLALLGTTTVFSASAAAVRRGWLPAPAARPLRVAATLAVLGTLLALTVARNRVYADPLRLWEDSVAQAPRSERALFNLANEYARRGQTQQAVEQLQALIRLNPGPTYYLNLAQRHLELDRNGDALDALEQARRLAPTWAIIHRNLARAYTRAGRLPEALTAAEQATELEPLYAPGYQLLADTYRRLGSAEDAQRAYERASTLRSGTVNTR